MFDQNMNMPNFDFDSNVISKIYIKCKWIQPYI